jgi:SAM-dependent methyltransferase
VGLDFSQALLEEAQTGISGEGFTFLPADLSNPDWDDNLPGEHFDVVLAFAVLHHLPGAELRLQVVSKVHAHLIPGGKFIHSNWQFLNSARMRSRIQPWERVDMTPSDVDPGDYLLDWRRGGYGLRYVHHFSREELETLAAEAGFRVVESFHSDGKGGKLGLYQVWEPV